MRVRRDEKYKFIEECFPYEMRFFPFQRISGIDDFTSYIWYAKNMSVGIAHRFAGSPFHINTLSLLDTVGETACISYNEFVGEDRESEIEADPDGLWIMSFTAVAFKNESDALWFKLSYF